MSEEKALAEDTINTGLVDVLATAITTGSLGTDKKRMPEDAYALAINIAQQRRLAIGEIRSDEVEILDNAVANVAHSFYLHANLQPSPENIWGHAVAIVKARRRAIARLQADAARDAALRVAEEDK